MTKIESMMDERAAFEEATRKAAKEFGDEANDEGFTRDASGEFAHRETMQLHRICQLYRAALATQPADGEPVAYAAFADNGNVQMWCKAGIDVARIFESTGKKPVPLYAAQPAAAPVAASEPVEVIARLQVHDYFPNSSVSRPDLQFRWAISPERQRELVRTIKEPIKLVALTSPPAAAHGDEAVRFERADVTPLNLRPGAG